MGTFYVNEVFQNDEIEILKQSDGFYQIGRIYMNHHELLFYSETTEKGGCRFGVENYEALYTLLSLAKESEDSCILLMFLSSVGANLGERTKALDYYAEIFKLYVDISRRYLTISIVSGNCVGGSAYLASLSDILLFSKHKGNLCITGPRVVASVLGVLSDKQQLGGYETQASSGTISKAFQNSAECRNDIEFFLDAKVNKQLFATSPSKQLQPETCVFNNQPYDMMEIIDGIVDSNSSKIIFDDFGKSIITTIARIEGHFIGIIASQPRFGWGAIDTYAAEKMSRFLKLCSKVQLPMLIIADVPSFLPGKEQESKGIQWRGADFLRDMILYEGKKVTLIVHKSYGGAYIALNSIRLGATAVYAWKNAQIGIMGVSAEKEINGEIFSDYGLSLSAKANLEYGSLSAIIEPENTRKILYETLWGNHE